MDLFISTQATQSFQILVGIILCLITGIVSIGVTLTSATSQSEPPPVRVWSSDNAYGYVATIDDYTTMFKGAYDNLVQTRCYRGFDTVHTEGFGYSDEAVW